MSAKMLTVLAALAVVLGGLAALVGRGGKASQPEELGPLHPGLTDRLNEAAVLEVAGPEGGYTVRLEGDRWVLAEKGGYPVKLEEVRGTLWALAELEKRQPMTDDPARYGRLGVQDVAGEEGPGGAPEEAYEGAQEGTPSRRIVVRDAQGRELAALIVGQTRGTGRGPAASFYARKPSEKRAWLVGGTLPLPADAQDWLDRQPVKLERKEVRAVRTRHPDGETVLISRPDADQSTFDVHDVPEGRELRYATIAAGMASALEHLSFEDVLPASELEAKLAARRDAEPDADPHVEPDAEPGDELDAALDTVHDTVSSEPVVTTIWTFDGLRIDARVWSVGEDEHWVAFDALHDEVGPPELVTVGPEPPPPGEEGEEEPAGLAPEEPATSPEEVAARAAELRARVDGWAYRIAPYNRGNLAKRMDDLTQAPAGEGGPPDSLAPPEWDVDFDWDAEWEPEPAPEPPAEGGQPPSEDPDHDHAEGQGQQGTEEGQSPEHGTEGEGGPGGGPEGDGGEGGEGGEDDDGSGADPEHDPDPPEHGSGPPRDPDRDRR